MKPAWKGPEDYDRLCTIVDLEKSKDEELTLHILNRDIPRFNPRRKLPTCVKLENIGKLTTASTEYLAWLHEEIDIIINDMLFPSLGYKKAYYYGALENFTLEELKKLEAYNERVKEKVREKNFNANWDDREKFYQDLTQLGWANELELFYWDYKTKKRVHKLVPEFSVYSPSGKTYVECLNIRQLDIEALDVFVPEIAPREQVDIECGYWEIELPQVYMVRASTNVNSPKTGKSQGFTEAMNQISYWPDKEEMTRHLYDASKYTRIPNSIRRKLKADEIYPVNWANIAHEEHLWLMQQDEDTKLLFKPLDIEICPICQNRYNIKYGCEDPETQEEHVMGIEFCRYSEYWSDSEDDDEDEEEPETPASAYDDDDDSE